MGLAPSLIVNLPGYPFENFPSVATIALLRQIPSTPLEVDDNYLVDGGLVAGDGGGGAFAWSPFSVEADDGVFVIKPNDLSPGQAGRWVLTGAEAVRDISSSDTGKGAALVGLDQTKTGPDNSLALYFSKMRNLGAGPFNAKGDGSDENARVADWLAEAAAGYELEAPSGTFGYTTPIALGAVPNLAIRMAGSARSRLMYLGGNASADLFTAGSHTTPTHMQLLGFAVDSAISMNSSSHAFNLLSPYQGYRLIDLRPGSLDANVSANIWHGMRIDRGRQGGLYEPGTFRANGDCIQVLGDGSSPTGADLTIGGGAVLLGGDSAIHVGGGFGGIYIGEVLGYGNNYGLKCTRELVDRANREIIMSNLCVWDAQFTASQYYNMPDNGIPASNDRLFVMDSSYMSGPGFIDGLPATGVWIKSAPFARFVMNGSFVKSPTEDAYLIEDATTNVQGDDGCFIGYTGRDGIRSTVSTDNVQWKSELFDTIGGVRMSPAIRHGKSATMSVSTATGIGSAGAFMRYTRAGNTFHTDDLQVTIVTNGPGTVAIGVTMPWSAKADLVLTGVIKASGVAVTGRIAANQAQLVITTATGAYPGSDGAVITLSGGGEIYG